MRWHPTAIPFKKNKILFLCFAHAVGVLKLHLRFYYFQMLTFTFTFSFSFCFVYFNTACEVFAQMKEHTHLITGMYQRSFHTLYARKGQVRQGCPEWVYSAYKMIHPQGCFPVLLLL